MAKEAEIYSPKRIERFLREFKTSLGGIRADPWVPERDKTFEYEKYKLLNP